MTASGADRAHAAAFRDVGDEECPAADLLERRHHPFDAAAIGVGFDHSGTFDRKGHAVEPLPVGGDGGEVDGEHAAGFRLAGGDHRGLQRALLQGHGDVTLATTLTRCGRHCRGRPHGQSTWCRSSMKDASANRLKRFNLDTKASREDPEH